MSGSTAGRRRPRRTAEAVPRAGAAASSTWRRHQVRDFASGASTITGQRIYEEGVEHCRLGVGGPTAVTLAYGHTCDRAIVYPSSRMAPARYRSWPVTERGEIVGELHGR